MEDIKVKIRAFIGRFFRKHEIQDDQDIFELGFVNSLFAMQMIMFLEKEFSIRFETNDMDLTNFRTINLTAAFIESKRTAVEA